MAVVTALPPPKLGIPVSELLAVEIDPIEWLVPGYVQEQSIVVLAGPPNAGKTLLAADWCARLVAQGKRVFIGQNEGGLRGLQQRLSRSCVAAGIPSPPDRFTYRRNVEVTLANLHEVKKMAQELELHDLIVLDSLASFWPGLDENKPEHMSLVAEALKVLNEYSGAAVLGIHHTTKAAWKMGEKPSLGDIRGHGSMAGRVDGAFICKPMERVSGVVRFELHVVKQRDEDWTPPKAVEVLMTGDAATVTMEPLQEFRRSLRPEDQREAEVTRRVLAVMPVSEAEALSPNAIAASARRGKTEVLAVVKRLNKARLIEETSSGCFYVLKTTTHNSNPSDAPNGPKASGGNGSSDARKGFGFWGSVAKRGRNPGEDDD